MSDSLAVQTIKSITTIKKGASTASLVLAQRGDGSFVFTSVSDGEVSVTGQAAVVMAQLYLAIDALV